MQLSMMSSYKQVLKSFKISVFALSAFFALFSSQVYASNPSTTEGFPRAELLEENQFNNAEYRLVISGLKRKRAETSGEVERLITGDVERQFWQISTNHEVEQIIDYFLDQWQNAKILYRCKGLDCGSSNFWANEIFNNAKLYGRDKNQAYVVAMVPGSPNRIYVLYAVQRSKQKLFFNLDQVTTNDQLVDDDVQRENLINALQKETGWLEGFYTLDGQIDEKKSDLLISTLKSLDSTVKRRLFLVVHCYQANNMAENIACSSRLAQQLRAATYQGVEIPVFGQGALTLPQLNNLQPQLRFVLWPKQR